VNREGKVMGLAILVFFSGVVVGLTFSHLLEALKNACGL
jgi:hypothetical protein